MKTDKEVLFVNFEASNDALFLDLCRATHGHVAPWLGSFATATNLEELNLLKNRLQKPYVHAFVICNDNLEYIGFGFLNAINNTHHFCNMGYWIGKQFCGKGYAKKTAKCLLDYAYSELHMVRVKLLIEPENTASIRVAQSIGCKKEGLMRKRIFGRDAFMYAHTCP